MLKIYLVSLERLDIAFGQTREMMQDALHRNNFRIDAIWNASLLVLLLLQNQNCNQFPTNTARAK